MNNNQPVVPVDRKASFWGALLKGALGGLWLGESLGQIGIFAIFIAVLLLRPQGLFGARV